MNEPVNQKIAKQLSIGDSVGAIYKKSREGREFWELVEDKITKISITSRVGRRYFTKARFRPLDADEVDSTTKMMESAIEKGFIITGEVFELNKKTRPFAENWVTWANKNPSEAVGLLR